MMLKMSDEPIVVPGPNLPACPDDDDYPCPDGKPCPDDKPCPDGECSE